MDTTTDDTTPAVPLVLNDFRTLSVRFTTACFQGPGMELSLGPLQEPDDVSKHPLLIQRLRSAMRCLNADRVYAPSPTDFNGKIISPFELTKVFNLGRGVLLRRNRAVPADGTFLRAPGDAGVFSASGCGLTVAALYENLIFAHTGRECVIDKHRVLTRTPSRARESVVDYIVAAFLQFGYESEDLRNLHAWPLYSIKPEDFVHRYDDPKHGEYNMRLLIDFKHRGLSGLRATEVGIEIDIPEIVKSQFIGHGVPEGNIHTEHRYLSDELPTTRNGGGRYLVAVVRR